MCSHREPVIKVAVNKFKRLCARTSIPHFFLNLLPLYKICLSNIQHIEGRYPSGRAFRPSLTLIAFGYYGATRPSAGTAEKSQIFPRLD